tara:strand:- start:351 stop:1016 length:666 start_codon:yes stop_codon:yes gene_type:complete
MMAKKNEKEFTVQDQIDGMSRYLDRMKDICKFLGRRFTVHPTAYFWRNRYHATQLLLQASDALHMDPGADDFPIGPTIKEWRKGTEQKKRIVRKTLEVAMLTRGVVTAAVVEVALSGTAVRTSILKVLNEGVDVGVLTKIEVGGNMTYKITKKASEEMAERAYVKLLHPAFLEAARFAIALEQIEQSAIKTGISERRGSLLPNDHQSMIERLYWGDNGRPD